MLAGRALAPRIAGALIYLRGFHPVFLLCSATGAVVLLLLSQVSEARGRAGAAGGFGLSWGVALVGAVEASCYMGYQAFETYLPLFESMRGAEWLSGLLLSFMIAVMAFLKPLAGYLSDRAGRGKPIALGLALLATSLMALSARRSAAAAAASAALLAAGLALVTASTKPLAAEICERSGAAIG
ncbi:MAG: hypothetical protein DRN96_07425, partial [Thermoproteota archaeon]